MIKKSISAAPLIFVQLFILPILALFIILPITAFADVILEPPDDFYSKNHYDCRYLNRNYYANGVRGYIVLKSEPGSDREVATYANGEVFNISFTYGKGAEEWGVIMFDTEGKQFDQWKTGWVPMSELALVYDYIAFEEDNKDSIYNASLDAVKLFQEKEIIFWTWPGSGIIMNRHSVPIDDPQQTRLESGWLSADTAYIDGEGREWGFIGYFYGIRGAWVCFSDSANAEIPAFNPAPDPKLWPAAEPGSLPNIKSGPPLQTIIVLVGAIVAGTAVMIRRIF